LIIRASCLEKFDRPKVGEFEVAAYVMDMGWMVQSGASSELMHDPASRSAYLGALTE
jgi:ABC-type branched-subunit amino acid transport system ATPase component